MVIKSIIGAACTCLLVVSFNANASIISVDWKVSDDNSITRDTTSGLDWLDLTETSNRSYNDVSTKFGAGEEFDGWRYANTDEISRFWDSFV